MNNQNSKLVSIIIPTYNTENFIAETILSAINQTYADLEIIVVDDCSKDNTVLVVKNLAKKDSRIKLYIQNLNQGAAVARNRGIELSRGRYLAFLDSDDLWADNKIEKQIDLLKSDKSGFCFTAYSMIDNNGNTIKNKIKIKEKVDYSYLLKRTIISTPTVVIDREVFPTVQFPLRRTGQDYALWLSLLKKTNYAIGIDEALVVVRRRNSSLSSNKLQNILDVWSIQRKYEKINILYVLYNIIYYAFFSVRKRFF